MPGVLGYGFHESNRGEYLAQYFLSALGVSAPVIRQEDVGVDFFCSLARVENKRLTFHSPFTVQHGAAGAKDFVYGGYTKEGKWRSDSINWLFAQELPLFVCVTDRLGARFRLYSTSAMWATRYQHGSVTQVELCPDESHDANHSKSDQIGNPCESNDGYSYRVPLSNPIVDLAVSEVQDNRAKAVEALTIAIEFEQANITFRRLGVHVATWFPSVQPNDPNSLRIRADAIFWNEEPGRNVGPQIASLKKIAITLALNLHAQRDEERLNCVAGLFRLFRSKEIDPWILKKLPPAVLANLRTD